MNLIRPESRQRRPSGASKVFKGVLFDVWQWDQTLFDGKRVTFETLSRPDTVLVLPVLPEGQVILVDEEQPGMESELRALGGRMQDGESPEDAARRELLEESGYLARELTLWDAWQPTTKIDWAVYLFIARGLEKRSTALDGGERISLRHVNVNSLFDAELNIRIGDSDLLYKIYQARACRREGDRVRQLLSQHP
jgi:ADP-ribose pyrophosphatase